MTTPNPNLPVPETVTSQDRPPTDPPQARDYPPYRPTLAIFLIMPILAALVALLISERIAPQRDGSSAAPPAVTFVPSTLIDSLAPDFSLPSPFGDTISLSDQRGKWVILNFWATWCAPCKEEMPAFQNFVDNPPKSVEQLGEIALIAVNRDETAPIVQKFLAELDLSLTVALDKGSQISNRYSVLGMPTTYFIDPKGIVRAKHVGGLDEELLRRTLESVAEKASSQGQ
ncbi:MAG: hypothetical protein OHK0023_12800 [Anaerolineae bacterium]